jgi:hypothetical protein
MTEGIFNLLFSSDNEIISSGFAAFKNGKIKGGNEEFSYHGVYSLHQQIQEQKIAFDANISVQYYKGINLAILGKIAQFPVEISGVFTADKIHANGKIMKFDRDEINLDGVKIDDLLSIDQSGACGMFSSYSSSLVDHIDRQQLITAFDAYQYGHYVNATNAAYSVISRVIDRLFCEVHESNVEIRNLMDKTNVLIDRNIVPNILKAPLTALVGSDKVLDKKYKSPENCAFPLCIIAFNSLDKLVKIAV